MVRPGTSLPLLSWCDNFSFQLHLRGKTKMRPARSQNVGSGWNTLIMEIVGASTSGGAAHTKQPSLLLLGKKTHGFEIAWILARKGAKRPILREIWPRKKCTPNIGADIGAITGILLIQKIYFFGSKRNKSATWYSLSKHEHQRQNNAAKSFLKNVKSVWNFSYTYCIWYLIQNNFFGGVCVINLPLDSHLVNTSISSRMMPLRVFRKM
jgi:hypothetical protein